MNAIADFFAQLFDTRDFPARWHCGRWSDSLGWLHIGSDLATFGAYVAIPVILGRFVLARRDIPFPRVFWLFSLFIFTCGTVHLVEALIFWWPAYRFSGLMKLSTAVASVATAIALVPIVPRALALPSPSDLEREIRERGKVEEALRRSQRRFHGAFYSAPIGMALLDRAGRFLLVNRSLCQMLGYGAEELGAMTLAHLYHPEDADEGSVQLARVSTDEIDTLHVERRFMHRDGRAVWVAVHVTRMRGRGDEMGSDLIAQLQDISERRAALDELRALNQSLEQRVTDRTRDVERHADELARSNQELEQFAYVASHDLKAPLRAIAHLAEWIRDDIGGAVPAESREHLDLLRGRVARMERMIDDILDYSRAGRLCEREVVDTGELVRGIVGLLPVPGSFTIRIADDMPVMEAARAPLAQVFANLVSNALKHHGRRDGTITVSARDADEFWEFAVADDGPGIAREDHERMFQMFQTLRPRDRIEGSGIGLAIVKKVVERRGGKVRVQSEPGRGATFRFTWPKSGQEAEQ